MIDLKFLRENPEVVKQNIKNKFQDHKLPLVDEVIELDAEARKTQQEADDLRAKRNQLSKEIGKLMGQGKKDEAEAVKTQVAEGAARLAELEEKEKELQEKVTKIMMTIPNIILLSDGRYCACTLRSALLRERFHDRPRFYLRGAAVYDPQQCCDGRYEF